MGSEMCIRDRPRRDAPEPRRRGVPAVARSSLETMLRSVADDGAARAFFAKPVDAVALGIPDYPSVVKRPMDLGTVRSKLDAGAYASPEAFAADVRLVFDNATTFNKDPTEPVHEAAVWLRTKFDDRFADALADALDDDDDDDDGDDDDSCPDVGRKAKHKFPGFGKEPWNGVVVSGDSATLTIKWDEDDEPATYPAAKAARWLL